MPLRRRRPEPASILSNERPPSRTVAAEVKNGTSQVGTSFQARPVLVLAGGCEYMISPAEIFFRGAYPSGHTGPRVRRQPPGRRPPSRCDLRTASAIGTMAGEGRWTRDVYLF